MRCRVPSRDPPSTQTCSIPKSASCSATEASVASMVATEFSETVTTVTKGWELTCAVALSGSTFGSIHAPPTTSQQSAFVILSALVRDRIEDQSDRQHDDGDDLESAGQDR